MSGKSIVSNIVGRIMSDDRFSKVVSFEYKSKISEISLSIIGLKKHLWSTNRKEHNNLLQHFKTISNYREIHRHWVMMDPEVTVHRMIAAIEGLQSTINLMVSEAINESTKEYLNSELDKLESLKTMALIDKHEKSFFKQ